MAKLRMKKIELIALLTDSKKIIELIQRRGVVELCKTDEGLPATNVTAVISEFEKFRTTASQALDILDRYSPEKAGISAMLGSRTEVEKHAFGREAMHMEKIMNSAGEIIRNNQLIADAEAQTAQLELKCDTLKQWLGLDIPLNFRGTASTTAFIGTVPYLITAAELTQAPR